MNLKDVFEKIDSLAKENKTPIYAVGGFVRDLVLGKTSPQPSPSKGEGGFKDVDFVVEGSGIEFVHCFDEFLKKQAIRIEEDEYPIIEFNKQEVKGRLVVFEDFDTARYLFLDENDAVLLELEFAGARSEKYDKNSRKPEVKGTSLEEDLKRRDFTVNAMALPSTELNNLSISKIIDPFDGKKDLQDKILKTPLDPNETFSDDPLRMMRAVRFAARLNFSIEPKTLEAIHDNRERIKIVSAERIQEELLKILQTDEPSIALNLMFQTHLLDLVLPEVAQLDGVEEIYGHQHKNNLVHTFKVVDNVATRSDKVMLRLASLLHDIGKFETKKFLPKIGWTFYQHEHVGKKLVFRIARRLRLSKKDTDYLAKLVRWHQQPISLMDDGITDSAVRRLVVNLQDELDDLLILGASDITTGNPYKLKKRQGNYEKLKKRIDEVEEKDKLKAFQSPVRGEEIMKECNLRPGPTVGNIKEAIEEAILDGVIPNEYEAAKEYFLKIRDEHLKSVSEWEKE
jgi:poly(A) polymerase